MSDLPKKKHSRTQHSVLKDVPPPKYSHDHKKAVLVVGVGFSMLIVVGLYAASYQYNNLFQLANNDEPARWATISDELTERTKPLTEEILSLKDTVTGVLSAQKVRASSIDILRNKLQSATTTEEAAAPEEKGAATNTEEIQTEDQ